MNEKKEIKRENRRQTMEAEHDLTCSYTVLNMVIVGIDILFHKRFSW